MEPLQMARFDLSHKTKCRSYQLSYQCQTTNYGIHIECTKSTNQLIDRSNLCSINKPGELEHSDQTFTVESNRYGK